MIFLAHGALGQYDELIYLGVAVVFLVMMGVSWFLTRMGKYDDDRRTEPDAPTPEDTEQSSERFTLD